MIAIDGCTECLSFQSNCSSCCNSNKIGSSMQLEGCNMVCQGLSFEICNLLLIENQFNCCHSSCFIVCLPSSFHRCFFLLLDFVLSMLNKCLLSHPLNLS